MTIRQICARAAAAALAAALLATSASAAPVPTDTALRAPQDVLADGGALYTVDTGASVLLELDRGKAVVLAGYHDEKQEAYSGYLDGPADSALFNTPTALTAWMDGIVISDTENHLLRLVKDGKVRTLAGTGKAGLQNGAATLASFNGPKGLTVDDTGALLIADCWNGAIRKLAADGTVSTYASGLREPVALDWYDGTLYVADAGANQILAIRAGKTTVLAGTGKDGLRNGAAADAQFSYPMGIAADDSGVYVSDTGNNAIRKISGGLVSTLLGDPDSQALWPVAPMGMDIANGTLYVADAFAGIILRLPLGNVFTDVADTSAHYEGITWAVNQGITKGLTDTTFGPAQPCTRGQVVTFLWRAAGSPQPAATEIPFVDVAADSPYCQAILWAAETGITRGVTAAEFRPNTPVNRAQMVTFLWRHAGKPIVSAPAAFSDVSSGYLYADAITWAVSAGITVGVTDTTFGPGQSCTRGQAMTFLYRALAQ